MDQNADFETGGTAIESWIRRAERRDVQIPATVVRTDGSILPVTLRNISYDGCLLEAGEVLNIGERVTIALERMGQIKSQIRWASMDGNAGARFLLEGGLARKQRAGLGL